MSEFRREMETDIRLTRWTLGRVVRLFVGPMLLLGAAGWTLHLVTAPARAVTGVVDRTLNADAVLANYEWFKQTVQDVRAMDVQIGNATRATDQYKQDNPRPWDYPTATEAARLGAIVLGLENQRQNLVAEYNARSQMMNRSLFKTHDLPETLQ